MKFISTLTILCLFIGVLYGQEDTTIVMEGITIHDNRISLPFREASRNMAVIDRDQIINSPSLSVPEILSFTPGVDIRQRGPLGVQADVGIRGGTFEQTLVLVNGMKLSDPQTGHHSLSLPFNMDNIQQIEVLKGPGSRIFGQNAFTGAINFITRLPESKKLDFRAYGGSFGTWGGALSVSVPFSHYKQMLTIGRDASDGYRHNTDFTIANVFYNGQLDIGKGIIELMAGFSDRQFGANGFYASPKYTEQYEAVKTGLASVSYKSGGGKFSWSPRIYWRWNRDLYLFTRSNPSAYENDHTTNVIGLEWNGAWESVLGTTGIGVEFRQENINGDWKRGGENMKSNLDGFSRYNFSSYLEHHFKAGKSFDFAPGINLNWYSDFSWSIMPGIDMGYNLPGGVRIYANAGKSYRIPTFYDQYYSSPAERGNPDIQPEEAIQFEIGLRRMAYWYTVEANYFVRDASQLIDWAYNTSDSIWEAGNFQNIRAGGIEVGFQFDFQQLKGKRFFIRRFTGGYNYIRQDLSQLEDVQSRYALEHIRNQLIIGLEHRMVSRLENSIRFRYIDRVSQPSYYVLDDRLSWIHNDRWRIFFEVTNLTNVAYTEVMTPMPGRWIKGGVQLSLPL